ncbi:MFS general substrate transporter [Guyanagaster necrorhizus]|uniref:MFS general substrate transporter n=1 Tax=Guyanagaster necrorhizus TaxID=856835 RepID=A0A9P7VR60_9AGAR|nr:MFS general substrate transporter [Guyanagaster necrorhizus MCA 3950]KAG7445307.1 MFS general substrate transporter [Guyanagaster necrorhizus MCA 3950]
MLGSALDEKATSSDGDDHANTDDWEYPDGGLRAWLVVLGCFMFSCTCMAWGLIWGALQDYYSTYMFPDVSLSILTLVGGIQNCTMGVTSYIAGGIGDRYGYKKMIALSSVLAYAFLLSSAFSTKLYHVFLFQGVLLGFAQGLGMPLYMALPAQWFLRKRGFATGLAVAGSGIGGGIGSIIIRVLLTRLGLRKAMLVYSSMNGTVWIIAFMLIKERRAPGFRRKKRWLPERINGQFYSVALSICVGLFGYLAPFYFITTYTKRFVPSINPDSLLVVGPLVVMNLCGMCLIFVRILADYLGPINVFFLSFFLGGLFQILVWTFSTTYASIMVFAALYGLVGCWFISLLPVVCAELFGVEGLSTITGFMILMNAPGQLAGSSISGAILSRSGERWWAVTLYSGGIMILGACCLLYARFSKERRLFAAV